MCIFSSFTRVLFVNSTTAVAQQRKYQVYVMLPMTTQCSYYIKYSNYDQTSYAAGNIPDHCLQQRCATYVLGLRLVLLLLFLLFSHDSIHDANGSN